MVAAAVVPAGGKSRLGDTSKEGVTISTLAGTTEQRQELLQLEAIKQQQRSKQQQLEREQHELEEMERQQTERRRQQAAMLLVTYNIHTPPSLQNNIHTPPSL